MNQKKIGKFINQKRKEKNLTQKQLAEYLGVTEKSISNWENGRNMPDLSLFEPLCKILNITINELMSGEAIANKDYQKKLEENIINLALSNTKRLHKRIVILLIVVTIVFIILLTGIILYRTIELDIDYDERMMSCSFDDNKLIYKVEGTSVFNTKYITKIVNDNKYLIFHSTINLYNINHNKWEYHESLGESLIGNRIPFGSSLELKEEKDKYSNVIAIYTNKSLKDIEKLNGDELINEINNSYQMCSLN